MCHVCACHSSVREPLQSDESVSLHLCSLIFGFGNMYLSCKCPVNTFALFVGFIFV